MKTIINLVKRRQVVASVLFLLLFFAASHVAAAAKQLSAQLAGHAVIGAKTFLDLPKDAPENVKTYGKFTQADGERVDRLGEIKSKYSGKTSLPIKGQPLQGLSGIKALKPDTFLLVSDNGFSRKQNSADVMLAFHRLKIDWEKGKVKDLRSHFLHDPDKLIPFPLIHEASQMRYLTGADLDPEAIQLIGQDVYLADEYGPYLVRTNERGKVTAFWQIERSGKVLRSPDHYSVRTPSKPRRVDFEVKRSRGLEGMARSKDGRYLYPMLQGPLWSAAENGWEKQDGRPLVQILQFDRQSEKFTAWRKNYLLEKKRNVIGAFVLIDQRYGLVLERDQRAGVNALSCRHLQKPPCHAEPARFKRIYKVDLQSTAKNGSLKKLAYVDLLAIKDEKHVAQNGWADGKFAFPFSTVESLDLVDARHVVVANDNNFPYGDGRQPGISDDHELILLQVADLLKTP